MKPEHLTRQVFLSHTRSEDELAAQIAEVLKEKGVTVWDDKQVAPGSDWKQMIAKALDQSDAMIALLSPHAFSSSWVRHELERALLDEKYKNRLLPVLIGEPREEEFSRLPWILTRIESLRLLSHDPTRRRANRVVDAFFGLLKGTKEAK